MEALPADAVPILDKGFVRLIDTMGGDEAVVRSARVSHGNETKGKEADDKLIRYLVKHNHGSPMEHTIFTFHIRCPLFLARQWFRHRIGSYVEDSFNEISGRYVEIIDRLWFPYDEVGHELSFRKNDSSNKQSSSSASYTTVEVGKLLDSMEKAYDTAYTTYRELLNAGVCREQARAVLPQGIYTEFYWTVNARSLFNFISLRTHKGSQQEIQEYAQAISDIASIHAPVLFEAYSD